jgi:hypothetical protein
MLGHITSKTICNFIFGPQGMMKILLEILIHLEQK